MNAISNENTKSVHKAVTVDQLYSLVQPSSLVHYCLLQICSCTQSHAVNLPLLFVTSYTQLTMNVPQVPSGDILTAIDNDQVLIKKWTVRKDNRAQISVLTSVCVWRQFIQMEHYNGTVTVLQGKRKNIVHTM